MTGLASVLIVYFSVYSVVSLPLKKRVFFKSRVDHPEEGNTLFEGDILLDSPFNKTWKPRTSVRDEGSFWTGGVVPYIYDDEFDTDEITILKNAMKELEAATCVTFRKALDEDDDYISIVKDEDDQCSSRIGRKGGEQSLNLAERCFKKQGTVTHELMHALGFTHEQNRFDRDEFVRIHWDNIQEDYHENFRLRSEEEAATYGIPYDYNSIMHYSDSAWAIDRDYYTIEPLVETGVRLGQRDELSKYDIKKINLRYQCGAKLSE